MVLKRPGYKLPLAHVDKHININFFHTEDDQARRKFRMLMCGNQVGQDTHTSVNIQTLRTCHAMLCFLSSLYCHGELHNRQE